MVDRTMLAEHGGVRVKNQPVGKEPFGFSVLKRIRALPPDYTVERWRDSQRGRFRGPSGLAEAACGIAAAGFAVAVILHLAGSWVVLPMFLLIVAFVILTKRNLRTRKQGGDAGGPGRAPL